LVIQRKMGSSEKNELRSIMKKTIRQFCHDDAEQRTAGVRAAELLVADAVFKNADCILAYQALSHECDCAAVVAAALSAQKITAVPRVDQMSGAMDFYQLNPAYPVRDQLTEGAFGIREPGPDCGLWSPDACNTGASVLIIVPGLAFSADGKRLGRGKGFYDRYLGRLAASGCRFTAVGFCFACQILREIPVDSYDKAVDMVVSEQGLTVCHRASAE